MVAVNCAPRRDKLDGSEAVSVRIVVAFFAIDLLLAELRSLPWPIKSAAALDKQSRLYHAPTVTGQLTSIGNRLHLSTRTT